MTSLTRWNPFDELLTTLPRSLFGRDFLAGLQPGGELKLEWNPRCDVTESDGEVVVHVELPGVEAKDMDVSIRARNSPSVVKSGASQRRTRTAAPTRSGFSARSSEHSPWPRASMRTRLPRT